MSDSPLPAPLKAAKLLRDIEDFPKQGILFKDIMPVLQDADAFAEVMDGMAIVAETLRPDVIVGIESRGFLFGAPLALHLHKGFAAIRKAGKLPYQTVRQDYGLEYGTNTVEAHTDALSPGQRVLIVDDLLATGGTAAAACALVEKLGGNVVGCVFLVELGFLNGRDLLKNYDVRVLLSY